MNLRKGGFVAAALLSACGGSHPKTAPDAAADAAVDATPLRTIKGVLNITYVTPSGDVVMPRNLQGAALSALGPPSFTAYPGVAFSDGTFAVPDVPVGDVYLQLGTRFLDMSSDMVDMSFAEMSRPGAKGATLPTTLKLDVANLAAWQSTDEIQIVCPGSGTVAYAMQAAATSGAPNPSDTSLTAFTYDLSRADFPLLVDGNAGDALMVNQLSTQTSGSYTYRTVARSFVPAPFTITNGGSASLTGMFSNIAPAATLDAVWDRPAFDAELSARSPRESNQNWSTLAVSALPEASTRGFYYGEGDVLVFAPGYTTDSTAVTASWSYGDPYPASWSRIVWTRYYTYRFLQLGGATPVPVFAELTAYRDLSTVTPQAPIEPIVGAVVSPQVNGMDAFGSLTGVGTSPTVSWTAPTIGHAVKYYVDVSEVSVQGGATVLQQLASIETANTSATIPPGIMMTGHHYVFVIGVRAPANVDLTATPNAYTLPDGWSSVTSAILTP